MVFGRVVFHVSVLIALGRFVAALEHLLIALGRSWAALVLFGKGQEEWGLGGRVKHEPSFGEAEASSYKLDSNRIFS